MGLEGFELMYSAAISKLEKGPKALPTNNNESVF
jgi:hypothetical protein